MNYLDERAEIICSLSWPARRPEAAASTKFTVGRPIPTDETSTHQMPNCPLSLLRDADSFEEFYRKHLTEIHTKVREPWAFHIQVIIQDGIQRKLLPNKWPNATVGPYPPDQLKDLPKNLNWMADSHWLYLQTFNVASVMIVEHTGMTIPAIHELYRWLWATKDGLDYQATDRLRLGYAQLARDMLQRGDDGMAIQYGRVAFDLSPTKDIADELYKEIAEELSIEVAQLGARWNELAEAKENVVKKVATAAREGVAEWLGVIQARLIRDGLISPITNELKEFHSSGQWEARRQYILGRSSTNPYRLGLELMEAIENGLGFWPAMISGMLTEYPLDLRLRVPACSFRQIQKDSLWAPNVRVQKLAELANRLAGQLPFPPEVMPQLYTIHAHLDNTLPGIMTYALDQLAQHSKEEQ